MALELHNLSVSRGRSKILNGISATLEPGQIVGLAGTNGTGKSTLIQAIAGLLPYTGTIVWQGRRIALHDVGYMPQNSQVRADLTVLETVLLGIHERLSFRVSGGSLDAAMDMLEQFGIDHLYQRGMMTLSGGQQQLVLLAQKLIRQPSLMLLDEPTSALDIRHQLEVFERLRAYVGKTGALLLVAIHDLNLASIHTDRLILLHRGSVAALGRFSDVVSPQSLLDVYGIEAELVSSQSGSVVVIPRRAAFRSASPARMKRPTGC